MPPLEIPDVVIGRLPVYVRALSRLADAHRDVVSSQELGQHLGVTPAQIRKDLSYFGRFGKQGRGYHVPQLLGQLRAILGLDRQWRLALVGAGRLGQAVLGYAGFRPQFQVVKAFDSDPRLIGTHTGPGLQVEDVADLERSLAADPVDIGIVTVPAETAQAVIEALARSGVRAILNYAPIAARVPAGVYLRQIDPVVQLQSMTYYLKHHAREAASPPPEGVPDADR